MVFTKFLSDVIKLIDENKISFTSGKVILEELIQKDTTPDDVAKTRFVSRK